MGQGDAIQQHLDLGPAYLRTVRAEHIPPSPEHVALRKQLTSFREHNESIAATLGSVLDRLNRSAN